LSFPLNFFNFISRLEYIIHDLICLGIDSSDFLALPVIQDFFNALIMLVLVSVSFVPGKRRRVIVKNYSFLCVCFIIWRWIYQFGSYNSLLLLKLGGALVSELGRSLLQSCNSLFVVPFNPFTFLFLHRFRFLLPVMVR